MQVRVSVHMRKGKSGRHEFSKLRTHFLAQFASCGGAEIILNAGLQRTVGEIILRINEVWNFCVRQG